MLVFTGVNRLGGIEAAGFGIGGRLAPFWRGTVFGRTATAGFGAAVEADTDRDGWAGVGLALAGTIAPRWRIEAAFMPGVYAEGRGDDLGTWTPVFHTALGASRAFAARGRAGLSIGHKSDSGAAERKPGVETLLLSLHRGL